MDSLLKDGLRKDLRYNHYEYHSDHIHNRYNDRRHKVDAVHDHKLAMDIVCVEIEQDIGAYASYDAHQGKEEPSQWGEQLEDDD
jgi:hypothetical protein